MAGYYRSADVYVHAAHAEVWSLSITEALACGTPVVATAVGGIPEQVADGVNGFLFPQGNVEAAASAIVRLCAEDGLRTRLGRTAVEDVRRRFSLDRHVDNMMDWYKEVEEDWVGRNPVM